jgi:flagellin
MIINHNIPALNTYNALKSNNKGMAKSLEKLSTGLRINRAADDAAGLAISEKMRSQIRGLNQASRNAQDGISMIQTAEGALNETHSILQRMRELSVQAANDTYTSQDRSEIQKEMDQLTEEVDRIANTTEFNTKKLLDGTTSAIVSTDKLSTKAFVRDGLRIVDQFGQKKDGGGNYRLDITTTAGTNEVQKSDIFKVKHATAAKVEDEVVGKGTLATETITVGAAVGTSDASAGLEIKISGTGFNDITVSTNVLSAGASVVSSSESLVATLNADVDFAAKFTAVDNTANGTFTITAKESGVDFKTDFTVTKATVASAAGTFTIGTATNATTAFTSTDGTGAVSSVSLDTKDTADAATTAAQKNISEIDLGKAEEITKGEYAINTINADVTAESTSRLGAQYVQDKGHADIAIGAFSSSATTDVSASTLFEISDITGTTLTLKYTSQQMNDDGEYTKVEGTATITAGTAAQSADVVVGDVTFAAADFLVDGKITVGDKFVVNTDSQVNSSDDTIELTKGGDTELSFTAKAGAFDNQVVDLKYFDLNADVDSVDYGITKEVNISVTMDSDLVSETDAWKATVTPGVSIGSLATGSTKLYDSDKFWDASGNFILDKPQEITLVQGNGNKASITISKADTFDDVAKKLNDAIAEGLGQEDLVSNADKDKFVSFINPSLESDDGLEALEGTFVIRSAATGSAGSLTFAGDDGILKALSLTTIQEAKDSEYSVDVVEIHSGAKTAEGVRLSTNALEGIINENVDVKFDANSGLKTVWDKDKKDFTITGGDANKAETFVHLVDNSTIFHIGANAKQDIMASIGNMTSESLGVDNLLVTDNELSNQSIKSLDRAIASVSSERSKLGAIQNRMEHTINNLTTTSENLTAAESRIRDVDMAAEMMKFTKFQILSNAANGMMAQANQMPQSVLQLLR